MNQTDGLENVNCPWCGHAFQIAPLENAKGFICPKCEVESSLASIRNPTHSPHFLTITEHASKAAAENLHRNSAAYVYPNGQGGECVASGTVVKIGNKILLATVAHTSPRNLSEISLVRRGKIVSPQPLNCVVHRRASESSIVDVAIFELDPICWESSGLEAIGIDRIHDAHNGDFQLGAKLIGYPFDYKKDNYQVKGLTGLFALSYGCEPIEPERWPAISNKPATFDRSIHVVVFFSDDVIDWEPKVPVPPGLPEPYGMSGGGLWQRRKAIKAKEIWSPDDLHLIAIQSAILTEKRFLKAIQIIHWLKLVADEYPELRGEIVNKFPRLRKML